MGRFERLQSAQMSARRIILHGIGCSVVVALLSGCAMLDNMASGGSSSDNDTGYKYLEDRIQTLTARVTDLEQRNANLQNEVRDLQSRLSQVQGNSSGAASATELEQLRARVQTLEAQREKDKQVILDQVAKEIAGVAGAKRSRSGGDSSSNSNDVGYEHVVTKGQTLSNIATKYKVTVAAIKKANNLTSDNLREGQKLFIPKAP